MPPRLFLHFFYSPYSKMGFPFFLRKVAYSIVVHFPSIYIVHSYFLIPFCFEWF